MTWLGMIFWCGSPFDALPKLTLRQHLVEMTYVMRDFLIPQVMGLFHTLQPFFFFTGLIFFLVLATLCMLRGLDTQNEEGRDPLNMGKHIALIAFTFVMVCLASTAAHYGLRIGFYLVEYGGEDVLRLDIPAQLTEDASLDVGSPPTVPSGPNGPAKVLDEMRRRLRRDFYAAYTRFQRQGLTMKVQDKEVLLKPSQVSVSHVLPTSFVRGPNNIISSAIKGLDPGTWRPESLYLLLDVGLGVLRFGMLLSWVVLGFAVPVIETTAPLFAATIIHPRLRQEMGLPFLKGLVVCAFFFPLTNLILECAAYVFGLLALSPLRDANGAPLFTWDAATMQVIAQGDPLIIVFTASLLLILTGLSFLLSPYISYQVASGDIFGGVGNTVLGWGTGLLSFAGGVIGAQVGAAFQRQAAFEANRAGLDAQSLNAKGGFLGGLARIAAREEASRNMILMNYLRQMTKGGTSGNLGLFDSIWSKGRGIQDKNRRWLDGISSYIPMDAYRAGRERTQEYIRANQRTDAPPPEKAAGGNGAPTGWGSSGPVRWTKNERINAAVLRASRETGLDPNLILAVIKQESGFNPRATSPVGAKGLMQLMPGTAREYGVSDPYDIEQNVMGGSRYLAKLLAYYGNVPAALAAYNAGPGMKNGKWSDRPYRTMHQIPETRNYVNRIMADYQGSSWVQAGGVGGVRGGETPEQLAGRHLKPEAARTFTENMEAARAKTKEFLRLTEQENDGGRDPRRLQAAQELERLLARPGGVVGFEMALAEKQYETDLRNADVMYAGAVHAATTERNYAYAAAARYFEGQEAASQLNFQGSLASAAPRLIGAQLHRTVIRSLENMEGGEKV